MPPNRLLAALPVAEYERLLPHLEPCVLARGDVLHDHERPIEEVYFPTGALISLVSVMADGSAVEAATVGREGMAGMAAFHGVGVAAEQAFAQVPGEALRLRAADLARVAEPGSALAALLSRYTVALFTMAAQGSGCNRVHAMDERCARWLLMVEDGVGRAEFELTQHFLAQMLGVRRATVTVAAGALQRAGLIRYTRGRITIVDRPGLERVACECYGVIRSTFARALGEAAAPSPVAGVAVSGEEGVSLTGTPAPRSESLRLGV